MALGVVGGIFYLQKKETPKEKTYGPDVLAVVDGVEIKLKDRDNLVNNRMLIGIEADISENSMKEDVDLLIEDIIIEKEANNKGIKVEESELQNELNKKFPYFESYVVSGKEFAKKRAEINIKKEKLKEKALSWAEGEFFSARFDRIWEDNPNNLTTSVELENAVENDKKYAETFANSIFNDLNIGVLSYDQTTEKIKNDKTIGPSIWLAGANYTFFGTFDKTISQDRGIYSNSSNFWDEVYKANKGYNKPALIKFIDSEKPADPAHEAMYTIIKINEKNTGEADTYEEWLTKKKEEYKVKIFYKDA